LTLAMNATAKTPRTSVSASLSIYVDRLMEESRRTRVTDALRYGGYGNFLNALRTLPGIGRISLDDRFVEVRYAHESQTASGRRLVLIADRPLFFLSGDAARSRAGYELTLVELLFDADGRVTGTMAGAARVKPVGNGEVAMDDFADVRVALAVAAASP
jgi:hypothetical protein